LATAAHNSGFSCCKNEKHLREDYIKVYDGKSRVNELNTVLSKKKSGL
jgi:hypothetical protein